MGLKIRGRKNVLIVFGIFLAIASCTQKPTPSVTEEVNKKEQSVFIDKPFTQEYSIRYYLSDDQPAKELLGVSADRDWHIHILSDKGLLVPDNGRLFYPGKLITDVAYTPLISKKIKALLTYKDHTVYLDNKQIFSNAWAGKLQINHGLPDASHFAAGKDFHFLVSDGKLLAYFNRKGNKLWENIFPELKQIFPIDP